MFADTSAAKEMTRSQRNRIIFACDCNVPVTRTNTLWKNRRQLLFSELISHERNAIYFDTLYRSRTITAAWSYGRISSWTCAFPHHHRRVSVYWLEHIITTTIHSIMYVIMSGILFRVPTGHERWDFIPLNCLHCTVHQKRALERKIWIKRLPKKFTWNFVKNCGFPPISSSFILLRITIQNLIPLRLAKIQFKPLY